MRPNRLLSTWSACLLCCSSFLFSCTKEDLDQFEYTDVLLKQTVEATFYALTDDNQLVKYMTGKSVRELEKNTLTGLQPNERILAIDFRPATGQLYGVSNLSRIYIINQSSGVATAVGDGPFTPTISGTAVGFDFNPTVDRIRLVTDARQDLRLNPETGAVVSIDGDLNPGNPAVVAVAYTNSVAGAATTTLYDIDVRSNKLFIQSPPNDGDLVEVGNLGVQASGEGGFDISPDNKLALAVLFARGGGQNPNQPDVTPGNMYRFYAIDLQTGKASNLGKAEYTIIGLAIATNPVAYAVDASNNLLIFNPFTSAPVITKPIAGLQAGETVLGIDMRPMNGQLYALGSSSRLYTLNLANGAAMAVGPGAFTPALEGTTFGFDFNPTVDRIRVVSNTGQNLRMHPTLGTVVVVDGRLNPGTPMVDASAYTNSIPNAASTTLYNIDFMTNELFMQVPPNDGTQVRVGGLGLDVDANNGFDIGGMSGTAYAVLQRGSRSSLYTVNLSTGRANKVSDLSFTAHSFAIGVGF